MRGIEGYENAELQQITLKVLAPDQVSRIGHACQLTNEFSHDPAGNYSKGGLHDPRLGNSTFFP